MVNFRANWEDVLWGRTRMSRRCSGPPRQPSAHRHSGSVRLGARREEPPSPPTTPTPPGKGGEGAQEKVTRGRLAEAAAPERGGHDMRLGGAVLFLEVLTVVESAASPGQPPP